MKHTDNIARVVDRIVLTSSHGVSLDANNQPQLRCPHCLQWKGVDGFGFRFMSKGNLIRNQSWCHECRAENGMLDDSPDQTDE